MRKPSVKAGLGFCGLQPSLRTVRASGSLCFALPPPRWPRGQGAQTGGLGACVYLAVKEGLHRQGGLGSSWWPNSEAFLALSLVSGWVGTAG